MTTAMLLVGLTRSPSAEAVPGGVLDPAAAPWAALINYTDVNGPHVCSGTLIDRQWVLTAAHCARPIDLKTLDSNGKVTSRTRFVGKVSETSYTIQLGGSFSDAPGKTFKVKRNVPAMPVFDANGGIFNDWGLLQLSTPVSDDVAPMPLLPHGTRPASEAPVIFTGWGLTELNRSDFGADTGTGAGTQLLSSRPGDWRLASSCKQPLSLCYTTGASSPVSAPAGGDSGAAATADLRGSRVQVGVYSGGPTATPSLRFGASIAQLDGAIRAVAGISELTRMKVFTQNGSNISWFVDASGFRQRIPSASVFSCLTKRYGKATAKPLVQIASAPQDLTSEATCAGAGGPSKPTTSPTTPTNPSTTPAPSPPSVNRLTATPSSGPAGTATTVLVPACTKPPKAPDQLVVGVFIEDASQAEHGFKNISAAPGRANSVVLTPEPGLPPGQYTIRAKCWHASWDANPTYFNSTTDYLQEFDPIPYIVTAPNR